MAAAVAALEFWVKDQTVPVEAPEVFVMTVAVAVVVEEVPGRMATIVIKVVRAVYMAAAAAAREAVIVTAKLGEVPSAQFA